MVTMIRKNRSQPLGYQSRRVSGHRITYREQEMTVLYDHKRGEIITVLPKDADWKGWRSEEEPSEIHNHFADSTSCSSVGLEQ